MLWFRKRLQKNTRKNSNSLRVKKRKMMMMKQSKEVEMKDVMLEIVKDTEILNAQEIPESMVEVSKDKKMKGIVESCCKQEDLPKYDLSNSKNLYGEASSAGCDVCMIVLSISDFIRTPCNHRFCKGCIETYLLKEIQEDVTRVVCPESKCNIALKPDFCRKLIPEQVFDRWKSELNLASCFWRKKIQCPNPDCEEVFMDNGKGYHIRACPKCWNLICMSCGRVGWHTKEDCETFWRRKYSSNYGPFGRRRAGFGRKKFGFKIGRFQEDDSLDFYRYP